MFAAYHHLCDGNQLQKVKLINTAHLKLIKHLNFSLNNYSVAIIVVISLAYKERI